MPPTIRIAGQGMRARKFGARLDINQFPFVEKLGNVLSVSGYPSNRAPEKLTAEADLFISSPRSVWRENGAPVPADFSQSQPGRAPSHTKRGPPESALICDTDPHGQRARGDSWRVRRFCAPASHL